MVVDKTKEIVERALYEEGKSFCGYIRDIPPPFDDMDVVVHHIAASYRALLSGAVFHRKTACSTDILVWVGKCGVIKVQISTAVFDVDTDGYVPDMVLYRQYGEVFFEWRCSECGNTHHFDVARCCQRERKNLIHGG